MYSNTYVLHLVLQNPDVELSGRAARRHRYQPVDVPIAGSEAGHLRPLTFDGAKHALLQEELKVCRAGTKAEIRESPEVLLALL